jgi:hypothetical protein
LLAAGVVVVIVAVMAVGTVLAARCCLRFLRRHQDRRDWADLVARHRDLDRELTKTWERHSGSRRDGSA